MKVHMLVLCLVFLLAKVCEIEQKAARGLGAKLGPKNAISELLIWWDTSTPITYCVVDIYQVLAKGEQRYLAGAVRGGGKRFMCLPIKKSSPLSKDTKSVLTANGIQQWFQYAVLLCSFSQGLNGAQVRVIGGCVHQRISISEFTVHTLGAGNILHATVVLDTGNQSEQLKNCSTRKTFMRKGNCESTKAWRERGRVFTWNTQAGSAC